MAEPDEPKAIPVYELDLPMPADYLEQVKISDGTVVAAGDVLHHEQFGRGTLLKAVTIEGKGPFLWIEFENEQQRKKLIDPTIANLNKIDTDEDAEFEREVPRSALFGTARQWAELQPDLSILVDLRQVLEEGAVGRSEATVNPDEPEYENLKKAHKLSEPGDRSFIHLKLINGVWVIQDTLSRLKERLQAQAPKTPEEIAKRNADLKARNGTSIEWAQLQEDLSIAQNLSTYMMDGTHGHGHSVSEPGNEDYEELLKVHKLKKPGDASTVFKRYIDGSWVIVENFDDNTGEDA